MYIMRTALARYYDNQSLVGDGIIRGTISLCEGLPAGHSHIGRTTVSIAAVHNNTHTLFSLPLRYSASALKRFKQTLKRWVWSLVGVVFMDVAIFLSMHMYI